jgi:hypothetical protein
MVLPWRRGGRVGRRRVLSQRSRPRAASLASAAVVFLGACSGVGDPAPSSPRRVRDVLGNTTPTPTYSPTPTPTPTPTATEPPGRYALADAFPRLTDYRYRDVPARLRRAALRRWRGISDDPPPMNGPRIRYVVRRGAVRASLVAFAARSGGPRFDAFVRTILRDRRGGRAFSIRFGRNIEATSRPAGSDLWEVVFAADNLLVSVLALRRIEGTRLGRSIAATL